MLPVHKDRKDRKPDPGPLDADVASMLPVHKDRKDGVAAARQVITDTASMLPVHKDRKDPILVPAIQQVGVGLNAAGP